MKNKRYDYLRSQIYQEICKHDVITVISYMIIVYNDWTLGNITTNERELLFIIIHRAIKEMVQ